jgi:hypothetical protein
VSARATDDCVRGDIGARCPTRPTLDSVPGSVATLPFTITAKAPALGADGRGAPGSCTGSPLKGRVMLWTIVVIIVIVLAVIGLLSVVRRRR